MAKRKSRIQRRQAIMAVSKGHRLLVIGLLLSLLVGGAVFAQRGFLAMRKPRALACSPSPTPMPTDPASPSKEYIYAGGRLVATEEPAGGGSGCSLTSAPILITTVASGAVTVSWTLPSGATSATTFEVQRGQNISGPFTPLISNLPWTTTSYTDSPTFINLTSNASNSSSIVTYIYRVVASDGTCSQTSNLDLATNIHFQEAIVQGQTIVKAFHLTELRVAVNAIWKAANQTPATITWTDTGTPQGLATYSIKGAHIQELRNYLDTALHAIDPAHYSNPYPSYTNPSLTPQGTVTVKAAHINELRQRAKGN